VSIDVAMSSRPTCHLCQKDGLTLLEGFSSFRQVTSDCKPWLFGGGKGVCMACGTVQAMIDAEWREACHQIYSSYAVYHQADGQEQAVFQADSNAGTPRSLQLLQKMTAEVELPTLGRALDIGCGNGNFIRSLSALRPGWRLNGAEYNEIYRDQVLAIPGVEAFFSGELETISGPFDFVSLIHVLEHIENPVHFLRKIAALAPGANLLIEVPFFRDNPYELFIADHATHYTPATLARVLAQAGYSVRSLHTDWIVKEISAVAVVSSTAAASAPVDAKVEFDSATAAVRFLGTVKARAEELRAQSGSFGVFGTSIGGTWLYSELNGNLDFFVDEDRSRVGKRHLGIEIIEPSQIPAGSCVFMPLADRVARDVVKRLGPSSPGKYYYVSPAQT
jgi:trans-aconitate methyltransferase